MLEVSFSCWSRQQRPMQSTLPLSVVAAGIERRRIASDRGGGRGLGKPGADLGRPTSSARSAALWLKKPGSTPSAAPSLSLREKCERNEWASVLGSELVMPVRCGENGV